ncbi:SWIM zinc finger family protein [Streptomyces sp. P17]|uniref:SWIM zinc finger family protein n=1 Tax=Streptomyces sp. P17 TaxID=3074716 RepID=UPI0037DD7D18
MQGSRRTPYRSTVQVEQLTDRQWDRLLDMIAERAANIAALLDGEMPAGLADDATAAGVPLLPGPRDLDPACSCPDWGYPCKHAAALCYQVARLLDNDPFVLLLLRGRGERELMDELGRRNTARGAAEAASYAATPLFVPAGIRKDSSRGCFESPVRCPRCSVRALGVPDEGPRTGRTWVFGRCGEGACRAPWVLCGTFKTPPRPGDSAPGSCRTGAAKSHTGPEGCEPEPGSAKKVMGGR